MQLKISTLFFAFFLLAGISLTAQNTTPDSVCAQSQDVVYGILGANASSTYNWWLSDPSAGTIDNSIAPNDSTIQIDWGSVPGTYTLFVQETSSTGCLGDTLSLEITVWELPTIALVGDSVCINDIASITVNLTGNGPWIIDYTDGTTNYSDTATSSPHVLTVGGYGSTQTLTVTGLTDANGCTPSASLPSVTVFVYPKPTTGSIFHY